MQLQGTDVQVRGRSVPLEAEPIVFVVDDDISMREALESLIESAGWRVETFSSGQELLSRTRVRRASCLLLDYGLPELNGLEVQQRIAAEWPEMSIVFITGHQDVLTTVKAMKAGAIEFLTKPVKSELVIGAVQIALQRSQAALRRADQVRAFALCYASLSPRERQVMDLVVRGLLNKQIGAALGISEITVKAHRSRVMTKMKADSLARLVTITADFRPAGSLRDCPSGDGPGAVRGIR